MRLFAVGALLAACGPPLAASMVHVWTVAEIENAPALAVATVESVTPQEAAPAGRYWEAELHILRAFPAGKFVTGARIAVRYIGDAPGGPVVRTGPPIWPHLAPGMTALIPLASEGGIWSLFATEGSNLTVPAMEAAPQTMVPTTGRAFILAELANTLANGVTAKRFEAAGYLGNGYQWPDGFRETLEIAMGDDDNRWLEVACAVLVSMGTPHSPVAQLVANENLKSNADKASAWLLAKGAKRDYPDRLIRCTLRDMAAYDWGAANVLLEFKDSPLVLQELTASLTTEPADSIYAAYVLVRNGQTALKAEALNAAAKLVADPLTPMGHLHPAASLLRDYGSDAQLGVVIASLRRLRTVDEAQYRSLFGAIDDRQSQRALLADAVLLDDRRPWPASTFRYCDLAAASIEAISGQHFGMNQEMTLEERDRAVAAASAWLKSH